MYVGFWPRGMIKATTYDQIAGDANDLVELFDRSELFDRQGRRERPRRETRAVNMGLEQ